MGRLCHSNAVQPAPSLPLRAPYSELQHGKHASGGQKKRFSDHVNATLRKCSVPPDELEALAADREAWRDVCEEGLAAFDVNYDQEAEARRARRHTVTRAPASARPRCIAHLYVAESAHPSWGCGVIAAVIGHHC